MSADVGWSDDPVKDPEADNLNRDGLAAETAELIDRVTASKGSKVFGLTGPWGSGKTSLALLIETHLKDTSSSWKTARFTPWASTDTASMMAEFVASLADILSENERKKLLAIVGQSVTLTAPAMAPLLSAVTGVTPATIRSSATKVGEWLMKKDPWEKTFEDLSNQLEKSNQKALILVDDIDRLDQAQLALLLKIIRLLGRFPGIHYLLMYDEVTLFETLTGARDDSSAVRYANRYMEKIVQYQVPVPPMSEYQIAQRMHQGLKDVSAREGRDWNLEKSEFKDVMEILLTAFSTPRGIDRYLVQLERVLPLHRPEEIDDAALMLLTVLQTEDPTVYSRLPEVKNYLTFDRSKHLSLGASDEKLLDWQNILGAASPWEGSLSEKIVNMLFPATLAKNQMAFRAKDNSVRHTDYFDRYFVHTIHGYDVKDSDLTTALSKCHDENDRLALVNLFQDRLTHEQMWMALGRLKERTVFKTYDRDSNTSVALVESIARLLRILPGDTHDFSSLYDRAHFWLQDTLEHIDPGTSSDDLAAALNHVHDLSDRAEAITKALQDARDVYESIDPDKDARIALLAETGKRYTDILIELLFALLARQRNATTFDYRLYRTIYMLSYIGDTQRFQQRMQEDCEEVPSWDEIVACCMNVGLSPGAGRESIHGVNEEYLRRLCPHIKVDFSATDSSDLDHYDLTWGNILAYARLIMVGETDKRSSLK